MDVQIGERIFTRATHVGDRDSMEAVTLARRLDSEGFRPTRALISQNHGMLLFEKSISPKEPCRFFRTANCGYNGNGPRDTATILALFGFGREDKLFIELATNDLLALSI